ncbi:MAG TPA: response regulator [Candidatus Polarisedimenticolaceae bacterium]|nr:response regulator [Candidatus Polarisedimenticolaceae bacterium]
MTDLLEQRPLANILVVEDDDAQRQTLCDILTQEGFVPIACATATEALESAAASNASVAIVDLRLPDMTGVQVLERLMQLLHGARVIIHTAYGSFESARDALNLGAFAYVEKLSDPRELVSHVHRAMDELLAGVLRDGDRELRSLTEHVPDVVFQVDVGGRILFVNRPMTGRSTEQLLGEHLHDWVLPDHQETLDAAVSAVFDNYRPQECEVVSEAADGSRYWYSCRIGPIGEPTHVERAIIIARDITEARQAEQIERVVLQLFRNAREAIEGGGKLMVEVEPVVLEDDHSRTQPEVRSGPYVLITVTDTGIGIAESQIDRIFEPFFTTKPGHSKGLGLTEVYGIVAQAGGHMSVESEPGEGTVFRVYLPSAYPAGLARGGESGLRASPNVVYRFPNPKGQR